MMITEVSTISTPASTDQSKRQVTQAEHLQLEKRTSGATIHLSINSTSSSEPPLSKR